MRRFLDWVWIALKLAVIVGALWLGSCTTARTILKQAPTELPKTWQPRSYTLLPDEIARDRLQTHIYGRMDAIPEVTVFERQILSDTVLEGRASLVQWRLEIGYGAAKRPLDLVALIPNANPEAPIILSQNFCPNHNVVPLPGVRAPDKAGFDCSGGGLLNGVFTYMFGRFIVTPPLSDIVDRGYGFAAVYPSQFLTDSREAGMETLSELFLDQPERPGALAVWAGLFEVAAKIIETDHGSRPMIAYGHSRFAKTALLAGAWSDHIDAVLAHQSGTLGASALDDSNGEPLDALLDAYTHWPGPGLSRYRDTPSALPVRPADLLALSGDKPVLLGNARRDVWSDPWGAFKEAKLAWGAAFAAATPSDFRPEDRKAFWQRPGTHGVVKEDWPAFLDFLDAHMIVRDDNGKWRPREDLNPQPAD